MARLARAPADIAAAFRSIELALNIVISTATTTRSVDAAAETGSREPTPRDVITASATCDSDGIGGGGSKPVHVVVLRASKVLVTSVTHAVPSLVCDD